VETGELGGRTTRYAVSGEKKTANKPRGRRRERNGIYKPGYGVEIKKLGCV